MTEFRKSRQLVQIIVPKLKPEEELCREFIEIPGYLYYEEIYDQDLFVHHKIVFDKEKRVNRMLPPWLVSEPRTGLSIDSRANSTTRKLAVEKAKKKLMQIDRTQYFEAMLLGLANAPERKPRWRFPTTKSVAVKVKR